jgi:enamine deaminase RidA (YjgF/YER057c/UK114 family)
MKHVLAGFMLVCQVTFLSAQVRPIPAPNAPGVFAGGYLYLPGVGGENPSGTVPGTFDEQAERAFANVKSLVERAGLTMDNVVYTQVYLDDMRNFAAMNRAYAKYFPKAPPARACVGVAALNGTSIVVSAVAIRDLAQKKVVVVPDYQMDEPISAGILTQDRLFISAMRGRSPSGSVPSDAAAEVDLALDGMAAVAKAAGLDMRHLVFVNPYLTKAIPGKTMNKLYAARFEFGNTPARATIQVTSLPGGAQIEYTGVAVVKLSERQAIRPKNMPPSPTASPCVFAGDTLYCSAKSGFIPGPNEGIFVAQVDQQLRQTMRNLLDNLEEAGMDFSSVVSTQVYLDDMSDLPLVDKLYGTYFKGAAPARTTVQQLAPGERKPNEEGQYPTLEQISLIAIRKP